MKEREERLKAEEVGDVIKSLPVVIGPYQLIFIVEPPVLHLQISRFTNVVLHFVTVAVALGTR